MEITTPVQPAPDAAERARPTETADGDTAVPDKVTAQDAGLIPDSPPDTPHVWARGACLTTLTVLAVLFTLKLAQEFIVPVVMAIVIAYALDPIVSLMGRARVPRVIGILILMFAIATGLAGLAYVTQNQVSSIVQALPEISGKLSRILAGVSSG
ncbi:AI-2E family transporter, partial [Achromobacter sp.]|uniref:AI-2E family transporter n=1 Tax=Achromobacter sp. TaxID=134375 RepID=UPI0028AA237F